MKLILFTGFILLALFSNGQTFYKYNDSINHFSINIPTGWKYGINKDYPSVKLLAYYQPADSKDTIKDNFNINIFDTHSSSTSKSFTAFLESLLSTNNFKLIDSGNITIKGKEYKWLIESHENDVKSNIKMHNYVFLTNRNHKNYILTFVALSGNFLQSKELFYKIASSFDLGD
jgi:PsbP